MKRPFYKIFIILTIIIIIIVCISLFLRNVNHKEEPRNPAISGVAAFTNRDEITSTINATKIKEGSIDYLNYDTNNNELFYYVIQLKNIGNYDVENVYIAIDGLKEKYEIGSNIEAGTVEWIDDLIIIVVPFITDDTSLRDLYVVTKIEYNDDNQTKEVYIDPQIINKIDVFKSLYAPIVNDYEISVSSETNKYIINFYMDEPTEYTGILRRFYFGDLSLDPESNEELMYTYEFTKYPRPNDRFGYSYWNGLEDKFVDMGPLPYPEGYSYKASSINDIINFDPSKVQTLEIDADESYINDGEQFYVIEVMNDILIPNNVTFSHTVDRSIYFVQGSKDANLIFSDSYTFFNPNGEKVEKNNEILYQHLLRIEQNK